MSAIYITDLASYNEGNLDGFWLDLDDLDADEIKESIREFLEEQSEKYNEEREEYFVTDYDDIPTDFGEYPDIDDLVEYLNRVEKYGKGAVDAAVDLGIDDMEAYYGQYDDAEDFGRDYAESNCLFENDANGIMELYFDFERYGEDTIINGFSESGGYYFSSNY